MRRLESDRGIRPFILTCAELAQASGIAERGREIAEQAHQAAGARAAAAEACVAEPEAQLRRER
jgi:hypothetical protein